MNREFLKMLQSVAAAEKDPHFRAKNKKKRYDEAVDLMYPENVIVVASPTGKAPPPAPGETRVRRLSDAVDAAVLRARVGGAKRCSILVHEGLYIDALELIPTLDIDDVEPYNFAPPAVVKNDNNNDDDGVAFSLEIVGVKNVRLVFQSREVIVTGGVNLTLRNVLVYDRRPVWTGQPTFLVDDGARVHFLDVKINAPRSVAAVVNEDSKLTVTRGVITGCWRAIFASGSELRLDESVISGIPNIGVNVSDSQFEARDSSFLNCDKACVLFVRSRGSLENCRFKGSFSWATYTEGKEQNGLELLDASRVTLVKSSLEGLANGVIAIGSKSKPTVRDCRVTDCHWAFSLTFNSDAVIEKCRLHCDFVLRVDNNVAGKITLRGNKMRKGVRPRFVRDSMSSIPPHDFGAGVPTTMINDNLEIPNSEKPSKKVVSAYTKKVNDDDDERSAPPCSLTHPGFAVYHKKCNKCLVHEKPGDVKFKYCKRCEKVCYCSKQCQVDDWPDHRLACR